MEFEISHDQLQKPSDFVLNQSNLNHDSFNQDDHEDVLDEDEEDDHNQQFEIKDDIVVTS